MTFRVNGRSLEFESNCSALEADSIVKVEDNNYK